MAHVTVFDDYGRFRVRVVENESDWTRAYRVGVDGKGVRLDGLVIGADVDVAEMIRVIEATYHEIATPGSIVVRVPGDG